MGLRVESGNARIATWSVSVSVGRVCWHSVLLGRLICWAGIPGWRFRSLHSRNLTLGYGLQPLRGILLRAAELVVGLTRALPARSWLAEKLPAADGGEGVADVLDGWRAFAFGPGEGDHVETGRVLQQAVQLEIGECRVSHALLPPVVHRFGRESCGVGGACFHFDEDHGTAAVSTVVDGDDVEFADTQIYLPADDLIAKPLEIAGRIIFAALAERLCPQPSGRKPFGQPGSPKRGHSTVVDSCTYSEGSC